MANRRKALSGAGSGALRLVEVKNNLMNGNLGADTVATAK